MRTRAFLTLLANIVCFPLFLTASYCLQHWDMGNTSAYGASFLKVQEGQILRIVLLPEFWGCFPHLASVSFLFSWDAAIYTSIVALAVFYFARLRWERSFLTVGIVCSLASFVPYLGGLAALDGTQELAYVAGWHRFMLDSALYSAFLCGVFTLLHLRMPDPPRRRRVRIFQGPSKREVPPLLDISTVYLSRWL